MGYKHSIKDDGRECSKCLKFKPWEAYSKNKTNSTGHQSRCKLCCSNNIEKYKPRKSKQGHNNDLGFNKKAQLFLSGKSL